MRDNGLSAGKVGSKNRLVNILLFQNKKKKKNGAALFKRQQKEFKEVWLECWHSISQGSFVRRHYLSLFREFTIIFSILKAFRCWWVMGFYFTIVSVWLYYLCFYLIFGDKENTTRVARHCYTVSQLNSTHLLEVEILFWAAWFTQQLWAIVKVCRSGGMSASKCSGFISSWKDAQQLRKSDAMIKSIGIWYMAPSGYSPPQVSVFKAPEIGRNHRLSSTVWLTLNALKKPPPLSEKFASSNDKKN